MPVIRAFIAVNLSPEILQSLDQASRDLQAKLRGIPIRWIPSENIHLTLKFLGDVSTANLDLLKKILANVALSHEPCEVSVGGLGAFPKIHSPRVIWVGLEVPPALVALQQEVEAETARLGYPGDAHSFSPHLTLARVSRNATPDQVHTISAVLEKTHVGFLGATRIQAVHLFRSDLQPGGAVYSTIYSVSLTEPNG